LPLFRIVQEGLNNVVQHAHASSALVHLELDSARGVAISVRDNGRGFDPSQLGPADREGHFGLFQMRERILDLGGTLDIHSADGQGTELVITLPPHPKEITYAANQALDR
jgi:signal transduction histidine kinase